MASQISSHSRLMTVALATILVMAGGGAQTEIAAPHRKAGWWQMAAHRPNGAVMTRNLCLDAASDIRNSPFTGHPGCTMEAQKVPGGYAYQRTCGAESTSGTAIGDFNSAYKITEKRGAMQIQTDARWMGACPAGHKPDEMWMR
jgi:hypothetical protein